MPKITVIMPVYDSLAFFPQAVRCVLGQTHRDLELILVDDGSPNGCGPLCDTFAAEDARVRVLHRQNAGAAAARNAGLDAATGDYIAFMDSDDLVEPDLLATLLAALQTTGCRIAACQADRVDAESHPLLGLQVATGRFGPRDAAELFYETFTTQSFYAFVSWNKLCEASLWENLRFDTTFRFGDDGNIMHLLLEGQRIACVDKTLYHYRLHGASITGAGFTPAKLDDLRLYHLWYRYFATWPVHRDLAAWCLAAYWQRFYLIYVQYRAQGPRTAAAEVGFRRYRRQLAALLPDILRCPHIAPFEKLRALLFCLSPAAVYNLAHLWGSLHPAVVPTGR